MAVTVDKIGMEVCEALGLNGKKVQRLMFDWKPGRIAQLSAVLVIDGDADADGLSAVFRKYELVEKDKDDG